MSDLISREAAIEALACLEDYEEQAIEALRKLPSAHIPYTNKCTALITVFINATLQTQHKVSVHCGHCIASDGQNDCCQRLADRIMIVMQEIMETREKRDDI